MLEIREKCVKYMQENVRENAMRFHALLAKLCSSYFFVFI